MAKKTKKESWVWTAAKFTAVAVGGAVVGAYGLRAVDRYFIGKYGRAPFSGGGSDAMGDDGEPLGAEQNPRVQPSAIAPVIPLFGMQAQIMPPPQLHISGSGYSAVPSSVREREYEPEESFVERNPRRKTRQELKAAREADFESLVAKFESGEM